MTNRARPIPGRRRKALLLTPLAAIAITASVAASTATAGASTLQHHAPALPAGTLALAGPAHAPSGTGSATAPTHMVSTRTAGSAAGPRTRAVHPDICDFPGGYASALRDGPQGFAPYGGTTFTMPSGTTCADLRIDYVRETDNYEGLLQNTQTGAWSPCKKGWVHINAGYQSNPPALCSDVLPTTPMAVASQNGAHWFIIIED